MENYDRVKTDELDITRYTLRGKLHRLDGPAIEDASGYCEWYQHGLLHREDGPAVEYPDGYQEYWIRGVYQPEPTV